jgi:transposase
MREMVNAIFYVLRGGIPWRLIQAKSATVERSGGHHQVRRNLLLCRIRYDADQAHGHHEFSDSL